MKLLFAMTLLISAGLKAEVILTLHGSNTVGADLVPKLVIDYMGSMGAVDTETEIRQENEIVITAHFNKQSSKSIVIHAHGSSTGFASLIARKTDIAMSSRPIKHKENLLLMNTWGDMTHSDNEHVVALDGLAIVTHPKNPVKKLTIRQLASIFSGETKNWKHLGGNNAAINLYARDDMSGTYDTFNALVLKAQKKKLNGKAKRFESNSELVAMVERDPKGIGFTGLAYAIDSMMVNVSAGEGLPEIKPATFSVASEDYPLTRRLFLYGNTEKHPNPHVAAFIAHAKAIAAQQIVANVGFVAQEISQSKQRVNSHAPLVYQKLSQHADRLSTTFRLRSERSEIDTKSQQDISRLVAYFNEIKPKTITLVGFSANESDSERNQKRAYIRSKLLAYALRQHGFRNVEIMSFGEKLPIDSNNSEQGKYKNNRTEIWVSQS